MLFSLDFPQVLTNFATEDLRFAIEFFRQVVSSAPTSMQVTFREEHCVLRARRDGGLRFSFVVGDPSSFCLDDCGFIGSLNGLVAGRLGLGHCLGVCGFVCVPLFWRFIGCRHMESSLIVMSSLQCSK